MEPLKTQHIAVGESQSLERKDYRFLFKGKAGEYFSIWIVNVALTILTLGVYSAWAKVRTQQYFYGSTSLAGASFRYLADPKQILKGRVIAVLLFAAYYFSGLFSPIAGAITAVVLFLLIPYILTASMAFRARVSEWRHVRFGFNKDFSAAYMIAAIPLFIIAVNTLLPIMFLDKEQMEAWQDGDFAGSSFLIVTGVLSLLFALIFPGIDHAINRFRVEHSKYGDQPFSFSSCMSTFFKIYFIAGIGLVGFITAFLFVVAKLWSNPDPSPWLIGIVFSLAYFWSASYIQAKRGNAILNSTSIGDYQLISELSVIDMWVLYTTNTLAIVVSVGLLIPWAKVRTARYRASRTYLSSGGNLDEFAAQQRQRQSALGEEIGEMFDIGVGF